MKFHNWAGQEGKNEEISCKTLTSVTVAGHLSAFIFPFLTLCVYADVVD